MTLEWEWYAIDSSFKWIFETILRMDGKYQALLQTADGYAMLVSPWENYQIKASNVGTYIVWTRNLEFAHYCLFGCPCFTVERIKLVFLSVGVCQIRENCQLKKGWHLLAGCWECDGWLRGSVVRYPCDFSLSSGVAEMNAYFTTSVFKGHAIT